MKERVRKLLLKWGNSPADVKSMMEDCYDNAVAVYRTASAKVVAEYIRTTW